MMRIVYLGNYEEGLASLKAIEHAGHTIVAVFTSFLDKKKELTLVKEYCLEKNLPVFSSPQVKNSEMIETLKAQEVDVIVVVNSKVMIPDEVIAIAKHGAINLHSSLLPKYRGRAPVAWAILNDEEYTGVSVHKIDSGVDTGDIIIQQKMKIEKDDSIATLIHKMVALEPVLVVSALEHVEKGLPEIKQDFSSVEAQKIWPVIPEEKMKINWSNSSKKIYDQVRALTKPYPGATASIEDKKCLIWKAQPVEKEVDSSIIAGSIVEKNHFGLYVKTGDGVLLVEEFEEAN